MVTVLELAQARVALRHTTAKEWHGPCPGCGGTDRFWVNTESDRWFCRNCTQRGGDAVMFLRMTEGLSCPEAHASLGKECDYNACPMWSKCSQGKGGEAAPRQRQPQKPLEAPAFVPAAAIAPKELWQEAATKLIDRAHEALLACPEQLDYLASRGLPLGAVQRYRLGWLAEDNYRPRAAWGLPEKLRDDGKPKKLYLPAGIVIPLIRDNGGIDRTMIRRSVVKPGEDRYYLIEGSGDNVPVIGGTSKGFVVVESDLDALLIHWLAGDLVGVVPLRTCGAKPKEEAHEILKKALCILVALDYDARTNQETGKYENPGGKSSLWWCGDGQKIKPAYSRAKRWITPLGKDPGDAFSAGVDIREWILKGLPPIFHIAAPPVAQPKASPLHEGEGGANAPGEGEKPAANVDHLAPAGKPISPYYGGCERRKRPDGKMCLVADDPRDLAAYAKEFPDHAIFCIDEMKHLQGLDPVAIDAIIAARLSLPGSEILETIPCPPCATGGVTAPPAGGSVPASAPDHAHQQELSL